MENQSLEAQVEATVNSAPETPSVQTNTPPTQSAPQTQTTQSTNQSFDPSQITDPNLQQTYKNMQADYTKKMQDISTERAKYSQYEKYMPIVQQMLSGQQNQISPVAQSIERQLKEAGYTDEAIDQGKMVANEIIKHFESQNAQTQKISQVQTQLSEAGKLDARLNDASLVYDIGNNEQATFGNIVEGLVGSDPNWVQDPVAATRKAIAKVDAMINASKTAGKQELSNQAREKSGKFAQTNSSPQTSVDKSQPLSVSDAFEQAAKEIGWQ